VAHVFIPLWASALLSVLILYCAYLYVYKVWLGEWYFSRSARCPEDTKQAERNHYLTLAVHHDPFNNAYLTHAAGAALKAGYPDIAVHYAERQLHYFDGQKILWTLWDQYARIHAAVPNVTLAKKACAQALYLYPPYEAAKELTTTIDEAIARVEAQQAPKGSKANGDKRSKDLQSGIIQARR
jgi:hypothetical protein